MTRTITALYDSRLEAEQARERLVASGLSQGDITITAQDNADSGLGGGAQAGSGEHKGFFAGLKDLFMPDEDRHAYSEGIRRGGILLSARVDESRADEACDILEGSNAVNFDDRQREWQQSGWSPQPQQQSFAGGDQRLTDTDRDTSIPIAEERLSVGKRETERGGVRVRSYVVEQPVHEQVRLHEEHIDIERRPVNERVAGSADGLFEERTFEATERGEEAVVGKETVVTEELELRKQETDRVEDIEDTVRHTEVDVDDTRTGGERRFTDERNTTPPRSY